MIKQTFLTEDLLIQMIIIVNKYKNDIGGLDNPLSRKHPLLENNITKGRVKKFLETYDLSNLIGHSQVIVYVGKDNLEKPYPPGVSWISYSGRFAGVCTYQLGEYADDMYGFFIFDMERFEFVNYPWHDLEGIDEIRSTIYGRAIDGNYPLETHCPHTYKTLDDGSIISNSIQLDWEAEQTTFLKTHFFNNNQLPLDDIFFLSEEVVEGVSSKFIERMNHIRDEYKKVEGIDDLIDKIIDTYEFNGTKNVYFYPLISFFGFLHKKIEAEKIKRDLPFQFDEDLSNDI